MEIRLKNTTAIDYLDDLGFVVNALSERIVNNSYSSFELSQSASLAAAVVSGDIIINNGSTDLTIIEALESLDSVESYDHFNFHISGSLKVEENVDGLRIAGKSGKIINVLISQGKRGKTGDNIIDINKHTPTKPLTTQRNDVSGTTIYTTQANRPKISGDSATKTKNAVIQAPVPDVVIFEAGDMFSVDVDQKQGDAKDLEVIILIKYI